MSSFNGYLTLPLPLPDADSDRFSRLATLTHRVATELLAEFWTPAHLRDIRTTSVRPWKYFDEATAFEDSELYLPSRYRRCVLQKVGTTLRSHAERRAAFQSIQRLLPDHKIRRIHRRRIKEQLWNEGEYLSSGYVDVLIGQLNNYYDRHGAYPESYFELQDCPEYETGQLPYSPDDGQAVQYAYDPSANRMEVRVKTPDTLTPESLGDWSWTEYELAGYEAFDTLVTRGAVAAPEFHPARRKTGETYYELCFPVKIDRPSKPDEIKTVLAVDAGMRKDATCVVMNAAGEQLSKPQFIRCTDRAKFGRLHHERTRLNDRLAELRRQGRAHTDDFAHVQSEYERVNNKLRHKREQLIHDVANQIVALALVHDVDTIVHEDLRSLSPPRGEGTLSWELSSWARREVIEKVEYRADCAGIHVKRVFPQNTSRACPRCGSSGHTCKSPDHPEERWWGGHFRCDNGRCEFQGDRDYVGAVNVARTYFGDTAELSSEFTSSYTGDSELVLASRSAGTRLTVRSGDIAYEPDQVGATAGGGSVHVTPAVALPEPTINGSNGRGPAARQCSRFRRVRVNATENRNG
jgi:IS605 OrfB family transposase